MMGLCSNGNNRFKITRYENKDNYDMPFGVGIVECLTGGSHEYGLQ